MKNWKVTDIRWASEIDFELPLYDLWNRNNPLPNGFWQRTWEYPYIQSKIPQGSVSLDVGGTYPFVLFKNFPQAISLDCRDLNQLDHPLHKGLWPQGKLIVGDALNMPLWDNQFENSFSISAIEEMPDPMQVLKEMIRVTRNRIVITMDISDELGVKQEELRELEKFLKIKIPPCPANILTSQSKKIDDYGQSPLADYQSIRVLAFTIDAVKEVKDIGVLIPHWESFGFLKTCLNAIQRHQHPSVAITVHILDDSSKDGSFEKIKAQLSQYSFPVQLHAIHRDTKDLEADVGEVLDQGLKFVDQQYVAMIDADLFPIAQDWLHFPISILESDSRIGSVGLDTGLSTAYSQLLETEGFQHPVKGYNPSAGMYDNEWWTCTNNLYRVMRTATAKVVSEQIGWSRKTYSLSKSAKLKNKVINRIRKALKLKPRSNRHPYLPTGCDNGVAANHFIDINRLGAKYNIPITSFIGLTPQDGVYGQNISGLCFHYALSTRALSRTRREIASPGENFLEIMKHIDDENFIESNFYKDMIASSAVMKPGGYSGEIPIEWYEKQLRYIQDQRAKTNHQVLDKIISI